MTDEAAEAVVAVAENVRHSNHAVLFGSGLVLGAVAGLSVGYFFLTRRFDEKYRDIADREILEMRNHYDAKLRALEARKEKEDLSLDEKVEELEYKPPKDPREPDSPVRYDKVDAKPELQAVPEPETERVFDNAEDTPAIERSYGDWDYAAEIKGRDDTKPFIIHRDEWMEGFDGHGQTTLTYFEGDDVLSDEKDQIIDQQDNVVGLENLQKFGHGSLDDTKLYIRNKPMHMDIEVVHSDGTFAQEVHGFTPEDIQHSAVRRRPPRRSRHDDTD